MSRRGEVLVAIVNNQQDWATLTVSAKQHARDHHWYRIPVDSVERLLKRHWAPKWLAFYQTKAFGEEAYAIHYYAAIANIHKVSRQALFPDESPNEKSHKLYYKLDLEPLQLRPHPITSQRYRRITFIPITFEQLMTAKEVSGLLSKS
ncbi:hypothetical protein H6G89_02215 [Oscillatoria sp. FACHB-1407]|uniref:hypothetical protein n=1 Tax=Oscillatoria sp. FACHB-1407 TaxID=2692847 RepID=UPI00168A31E3|nr:hypothetical protein [Oscillatoria sp. FACHB-1407]MBD2459848.1 hypothetical protein [Oscillatoria sp. FACHB-1407]